MLCCILLHCVVLHCAVLHCIVLTLCVLFSCIALYCDVSCYIALCTDAFCIVLRCISVRMSGMERALHGHPQERCLQGEHPFLIYIPPPPTLTLTLTLILTQLYVSISTYAHPLDLIPTCLHRRNTSIYSLDLHTILTHQSTVLFFLST